MIRNTTQLLKGTNKITWIKSLCKICKALTKCKQLISRIRAITSTLCIMLETPGRRQPQSFLWGLGELEETVVSASLCLNALTEEHYDHRLLPIKVSSSYYRYCRTEQYTSKNKYQSCLSPEFFIYWQAWDLLKDEKELFPESVLEQRTPLHFWFAPLRVDANLLFSLSGLL